MSDDAHEPQIIVIKRIVKKSKEHHGGAWKIAYADFVTAMMAFFLLMWLLSMLNKYQLMGISNYFNKPLKNVFVDNKKNDTKEKKVPQEQTKKYKMQMTSQEKAPIDARSRGSQGTAANQAQSAAAKGLEYEKLEKLKAQLESDFNSNKQLVQYKKHVDFIVTKDGLKISLHDLKDKPMFSLGKTDFEQYAKPILKWLTEKINQSHHEITIIGHTDAKPYSEGSDYTNWELSADRANATRRVLVKYGMKPENIIRVEGAAASVLLNKKSAESPMNRRIDIILLTDEALVRMLEN